VESTQTIIDFVAEIDDQLGDNEGVTVIIDGATKERVGVLLSAAMSTRCGGCGQTVAFAAHQVEGWFDRGRLRTTATWSRQHGCGTWPAGMERAIHGDDLADPYTVSREWLAEVAAARN